MQKDWQAYFDRFDKNNDAHDPKTNNTKIQIGFKQFNYSIFEKL